MNLLIDTHLILWAVGVPDRLPAEARALIESEKNTLFFSAASLWEVTIKAGIGRSDFQVNPLLLRRGLIENDWQELAITSEHVVAVSTLPGLHKDPFDRLLIAQANQAGLLLLTSDEKLAGYPGSIRKV